MYYIAINIAILNYCQADSAFKSLTCAPKISCSLYMQLCAHIPSTYAFGLHYRRYQIIFFILMYTYVRICSYT